MDEPKKEDLVFNVMPTEGKNFAAGVSPINVPSPAAAPGVPTEHSRKWLYVIIGVVVLLALAGAAYYMLGMKDETVENQTTSRLPKQWMNTYFNADTCTEQLVCGDAVDPENDGLGNYDEFVAGTNPLNPDSDTDGLADGDEVNIYKTDPMLKYTDRREVVAQNDWSDGYQIKNGFDPLTPALKFTDTRNKQIADATVQFKLHEPSVSTTTTSTEQTKTFTSSKYGVEFIYPSSMKVTESKSNRPKFENGTGLIVADPGGKWSYGIDIKANDPKVTLKQAYDENYNYWSGTVTVDSDYQIKDFKTSDIKVDGLDAKKLFIANFGDVGSTTVSVVNDKFVYLIAGGGSNNTDLDNFLSTLKFAK